MLNWVRVNRRGWTGLPSFLRHVLKGLNSTWPSRQGFPAAAAAAATAKSLQLCPTLCDPIDGSPPGSPVPGILQARTLERVAISFSHAWQWKVKVKSLSRVQILATPWTAAHQAPPSMGFSRQEYWSGVPLPSPRFLGGCNVWGDQEEAVKVKDSQAPLPSQCPRKATLYLPEAPCGEQPWCFCPWPAR